MSTFKEDLYQKHGFIYEVEGTYYVIGASTFAKVNDSAEIDNVELLQNALKKNNERQIAKYLDKIIRIATTYRVDAKEHMKLRDKLYAFVDELEKNNSEEFIKLQHQVSEFDELFARYSKHNDQIQ